MADITAISTTVIDTAVNIALTVDLVTNTVAISIAVVEDIIMRVCFEPPLWAPHPLRAPERQSCRLRHAMVVALVHLMVY